MKLVQQLFLFISIITILSSCKNDDPTPDTTPVIESFSPEHGTPGTTVTITGKNFSENSADYRITFDGIQAEIVNVSTTQITVIVPQGASTGKITLELHNTTVTSARDFTCTSSTSPTPLITSFFPTSGPVGSTVSIYGSNFSTTPSENTVTIGDIAAMVTSASPTQLTVTVPVGAISGRILVRVNNLNGISADSFTVTIPTSPIPAISTFTPTTGRAGTIVTISGANFSPTPADNIVKLGTVQAQVTSATATQLVITIPDGAPSTLFTVTINGVTVTSHEAFLVIPPPTIDSFSPAGNFIGSSMSIFGTRFSTTGGNTVKFGDIEAEITEAIASKITVKVPPGASTGKIHVTVDGVTVSTTTDFLVLFPPMITDITPLQGSPGDLITITGQHFLSSVFGSTLVVFSNNKVVAPQNLTDTEITVQVPADASTGPIKVVSNLKEATSAQDFQVRP